MVEKPDPLDLEVDLPIPTGLKVDLDDHPFRILWVTDFAGTDEGTLVGALEHNVVDVTADTLHELLKTACPTVRWKTTDPTSAHNAMVELELAFDSFRSFDPLNLASQIPATRTLMAAREKIVERLRGKLTTASLIDSLAEFGGEPAGLSWLLESLRRGPAPETNPAELNGILEQLDFSEGPTAPPAVPPKSPLSGLVSGSAADGSSIPSEEASALRRAVAEMDRRLSAWLTAVLHAPPIQALESAWRSLAFLVAHIDFRRGIRLSVLHARRGDTVERLRTGVIDPVFDAGMAGPHLIAVDQLYGQSAADIEALDELAQHAASLPAVVVVGAAPDFLNAKYPWQIATLPPLVNLMDQWQFAKWNTLRRQPYARALGVVLGKGLLRAPYRRADASALDYVYHEPCAGEKDLVWANGAVAIASAVARSVADLRWPTAFCGPLFGRVEGFETCTGGPRGDKQFGPADIDLPTARIGEIGALGINVVAALRDVPDAIVWNGVAAAQVAADETKAIYEVTLPYQLFAARAGQLLFELKPHLVGLDPQAVAALVRQHVRTWLPYEGEPSAEQLAVQARPSATDPLCVELAVTLIPPDRVLPGAVPIGLGYRLTSANH